MTRPDAYVVFYSAPMLEQGAYVLLMGSEHLQTRLDATGTYECTHIR